MKTHLKIASFLFILTVAALQAQPTPVTINPATGLPSDGSPAPKIDPATGLPQSNLGDEWQKAKLLMNQGEFEDSLQALTDYFERSRSDPEQAGMRLFSILDWANLAHSYPRAKQALVELRDNDAQKLLNGEGNFIYFGEVDVINQDMGNPEATYALFKTIEQRDNHLAGQCYPFIEDQLIQKGEYATCLKYMGDPESHFQGSLKLYRLQVQNQANLDANTQRIAALYKQHGWKNPPGFSPQDTSAMIKNNFIHNVRGLIEILVGTDDKADAEKIQREALAFLNDRRLETAVADAEKKIRKH